jgi:hypothetical protein
VEAIYMELATIRDIYDGLNVTRMAHAGTSSTGRMVLGDDVTMQMTDAKYTELVQAVDRLRSEWTKPEDAPQAH